MRARMGDRAAKDRLYGLFAEIGKAAANATRLEILDLLCQGEKTVEALAEATGQKVGNTSAHLR
ncbi:MAG: ArsR family transcriptional regulator, partial [Gemmatimonadota bacterium]